MEEMQPVSYQTLMEENYRLKGEIDRLKTIIERLSGENRRDERRIQRLNNTITMMNGMSEIAGDRAFTFVNDLSEVPSNHSIRSERY